MTMAPKLQASQWISDVIAAPTCNFVQLVRIANLDPQHDFCYAMLDGVDFSDSDLAGFNFFGASLRNCKFNAARIVGAVFSEADLEGSDLNEAADAFRYFSLLGGRPYLGSGAQLESGRAVDDRVMGRLDSLFESGYFRASVDVEELIFVDRRHSVASRMAEIVARHFLKRTVVSSVGILRSADDVDGIPLARAALEEVGLEFVAKKQKTLEDVDEVLRVGRDGRVVMVALSPAAFHRVLELTRERNVDCVYWAFMEWPASRVYEKMSIEAYRVMRDTLFTAIQRSFVVQPMARKES
jgi:hypothetical protein